MLGVAEWGQVLTFWKWLWIPSSPHCLTRDRKIDWDTPQGN